MAAVIVQPPSVMDPVAMRLADTYAQALLGLFDSEDQAEQIASDLEQLEELIESIPEAGALLQSTRIEARNRQEMISRIFSGRVHESLEGFLAVLSRHERMDLLGPIVKSFRKQFNRRENRQEVTLLVAASLDEDQKQQISRELGQALESKLELTVRVDPAILGGLVVQIGDQVFDASVSGQIEKMRKTLRQQRSQRQKRRSRHRFL